MKGISVKTFYEKFDKSYEDVYGKVSDKLLAQGLLEKEKDCIYLTERGIDISNYVMSEFLF
jgi:oxygen-independent coproporphyrinogen-3 oxidase